MSPVSPVIIRSVKDVEEAFIAFVLDKTPGTITPYFYTEGGSPGVARTPVTVASPPIQGGITGRYVKRTATEIVCITTFFRSSGPTKYIAYDVKSDTWTAEISSDPPGFVRTDAKIGTINTGDSFIYQMVVTQAPVTAVLRKLSTDLVTTDSVVASSVAAFGPTFGIYHLQSQTMGIFDASLGVEIDFDGTIRNPTAYDANYSPDEHTSLPASAFLGVSLAIGNTPGALHELSISGADLNRTDRSPGLTYTIGNMALNNAETALGIYYESENASPPYRIFDWIEAIPHSAVSPTAVQIKPTDFFTAPPGTLANLPDSVVPLGAKP